MTSTPHRCSRHGLALGPDDRCVLCHREEAPAPVDRRGQTVAALAVAGALVVGVLAYRPLRAALGAVAGAPVAEAQAAPAIDEGPPPTDLVEATKRVRITVYSASWCPHCKHAKSWLASGGHPFTELDVEQDSAARQAHRRLSPRGGVPVIDVDGNVLQGFDQRALDQAIKSAAEHRLAAL